MLVIKNKTNNTMYTKQEVHTFLQTFNGSAFNGSAFKRVISKVPFS